MVRILSECIIISVCDVKSNHVSNLYSAEDATILNGLINLQSGDQIVADMKEIVSEDKPIAYLFHKPQKVILNNQIVLSENKDQSSIEVTLSSWILISDEDDVPVSVNQVVTLVDPVESIRKMYEEKINGSDY